MAAPPDIPPGAGEVPSQPEALRRLLAYRPYLMVFIVSMVRDFTWAETLYQDICVTVCERWPEFPADADFGNWVRELARRRIFAALRARAEAGQLLPSESLVDEIERVIAELSSAPEEHWERRKAALREGLQSLPAHLRKLVDLRYIQNLSIPKIAEKLGQEHSAVQELLARARAELETSLKRKLALGGHGAHGAHGGGGERP